jgi:hypothetical protein
MEAANVWQLKRFTFGSPVCSLVVEAITQPSEGPPRKLTVAGSERHSGGLDIENGTRFHQSFATLEVHMAVVSLGHDVNFFCLVPRTGRFELTGHLSLATFLSQTNIM